MICRQQANDFTATVQKRVAVDIEDLSTMIEENVQYKQAISTQGVWKGN